MEAKHTPGPWRIEETSALELPIRGPGDEFIAVVFLDEYAPDGECEANANLIIAASGLLAACEIMLSIWEYPGQPRKHPFITNGGDPKELLKAAIAAAKWKP